MTSIKANTVGEVADITDYHIFEDAAQDATTLKTTLLEEKNNVLKAKNIICSDDVFMGPIADSCESALEILDGRMSVASENFLSICNYFKEVSEDE